MGSRDYYEVLGIARDASADDIKSAYRRLARRYHPDVNKEADAASKFSEAQEAYDTLSDAEKRARYDRVGHARFAAGGTAGTAGREPHYTWRNVAGTPGEPPFAAGDGDFNDLGSMFDAFFTGRDASARAAPSKGSDVQRRVDVPFATAALGGTIDIPVERGGKRKTVHLKVPPATVPGAKHRVRGEGAAAPRPGGKPGDLIIEVSIGTHPYLKRGRPSGTASDHPLDLSMDLPLSIAEAVEGAAIDVPVLDRTLKVKIPPGTGSHAALRLTGGGLALASGARGDLYVVTRIVVPCSADLPEAERDAIRSAGFAARPVRAWEENTD